MKYSTAFKYFESLNLENLNNFMKRKTKCLETYQTKWEILKALGMDADVNSENLYNSMEFLQKKCPKDPNPLVVNSGRITF